MHVPNIDSLLQPSSAEQFKTLPQIGRMYGFSVHALRRAAKSGHFPLYSPFGRRWYVLPSEVLAFVASCTEGGEA